MKIKQEKDELVMKCLNFDNDILTPNAQVNLVVNSYLFFGYYIGI